MRRLVIAFALAALLIAGCRHGMGLGEGGGSRDMTALGLFGGANINVNQYLCAGRAVLSNGAAAVKDSCFTGDSDVVLCSDMTNANPVRCTPAAGELSIGGSGNDVIAYVRVK